MSLFEQYETDPIKEANGVPVSFPPNKDGTIPTFIIAATSKTNQKYAKQLNEAVKPWRRNMEAIGDENAERIYKEVFIKTVLKGWENVQERDGTPIAFSKEAAQDLFKRLPRLYDQLVERANSIDLFREQAREEDAGN